MGDYSGQSCGDRSRPVEELLAPFPELDQQVKYHLAIGTDTHPWRLWIHEPYPYISKGVAALLGDAGHPV
ncbi:hypothetical protein F5884DRAFT_796096 [Xylogone sp. PMI_703]|nr:hypothetical protein F5884DRAFT_796096 [Xylogone sp. PMI_703]